MKTKNTSCLWRDTAHMPQKSDWSFNYKLRTRPTRKARKADPVSTMPTVKHIENQVIKSSVTLESLGLCFDASIQRSSIHA